MSQFPSQSTFNVDFINLTASIYCDICLLIRQTCLCASYASWQAWLPIGATWLASTCTGNEPYQVTWSSHVQFSPSPIPVNLAVAVVLPTTTRTYVMPYETVTFQLSTATVEAVTFYLTFGDGSSRLITADTTVGYYWSTAGQYTVNITAKTRSNTEFQAVPISIQSIAQGVAPDNMKVKADWDKLTDFGVRTYLEVSRCSVPRSQLKRSNKKSFIHCASMLRRTF